MRKLRVPTSIVVTTWKLFCNTAIAPLNIEACLVLTTKFRAPLNLTVKGTQLTQ